MGLKWLNLENIWNLIFDDTKNAIKVDVGSTTIAMPTDLQAVYKQEAASNYTTNLPASASYLSPAIDATNFKNAVGMVFCDLAFTWRVEHSYDGVNWYWGQSGTGTANAPSRVTEPVYAKYVRFVITNTGASTSAKVFMNYNLYPN